MQNRLFSHPKIEVIWNSVVDEVLGQGGLPAAAHRRPPEECRHRRDARCRHRRPVRRDRPCAGNLAVHRSGSAQVVGLCLDGARFDGYLGARRLCCRRMLPTSISARRGDGGGHGLHGGAGSRTLHRRAWKLIQRLRKQLAQRRNSGLAPERGSAEPRASARKVVRLFGSADATKQKASAGKVFTLFG